MNKQHLNNLMFLLAGSSLVLACDPVDDTSTSTGNTGVGTGGSGGMTGMTTMPNTTAGTNGMDAGSGTAADGTAGDTAGDTAGGTTAGVYSETCNDYGYTYMRCVEGAMLMEQIAYCEGAVDDAYLDSKECGLSVLELFSCLSQLDCRTFNGITGCEAESAAVAAACPAA